MSLLWLINDIINLFRLRANPSPRRPSCIFRPGIETIGGIPVSASRCGMAAASMTVEASLVLPLFLFFFLNLSNAIEMIRLHGNLELALWDAGNQMAIYGGTLSTIDLMGKEEELQSEEWWQQLSGIAFSYTFVKQAIRDYLGDAYLEQAPILGGINGLQFAESDIFTGDDTFEIVVAYGVRPFGQIAAFRPFGMVNHYYGHLWNGYQLPTEQETDSVYVTEHGNVYHEDINCTHLKLSIETVSIKEAQTARNAYGERYHMCELCGGALITDPVWITTEGNRIHIDKNCSGLKRTIYTIERAEAGAYRPCSRCAI